MSYTLDDRTGTVWRDDGVVVPLDEPANPLTVAYQDWLNAGGQHTVITTAAPSRTMTHLAFRRRFTLQERITIDNAPDSGLLPAEAAAALRTMAKDMELAEYVDLDDPDVIQGLAFLAQLGLLAPGRSDEILSDP